MKYKTKEEARLARKEKRKGYMHRYYLRIKADPVKWAKHQAKSSIYHKKRYKEIMLDPVRRKKYIANEKRKYLKIKADPILYQKLLQRNKEFKNNKTEK